MSQGLRNTLFAFTLVLPFSNIVYASGDTHSGQALRHSGAASANASSAAAHSVAGSAQVTSAAIAIPLSVGGAVLSSAGAVSTGLANESMRAATAPAGPLDITDEVIVSMPPDVALKTKKQEEAGQ